MKYLDLHKKSTLKLLPHGVGVEDLGSSKKRNSFAICIFLEIFPPHGDYIHIFAWTSIFYATSRKKKCFGT